MVDVATLERLIRIAEGDLDVDPEPLIEELAADRSLIPRVRAAPADPDPAVPVISAGCWRRCARWPVTPTASSGALSPALSSPGGPEFDDVLEALAADENAEVRRRATRSSGS
jgi:hypothetical protein